MDGTPTTVRISGSGLSVERLRQRCMAAALDPDGENPDVHLWAGAAREALLHGTGPWVVVAPEIGPAETALLRDGSAEVVAESASDAELIARIQRTARRGSSRSRYAEVIRELPDGAAVIDPTGRVVAINEAGRALFHQPARGEGSLWQELATPVHSERTLFPFDAPDDQVKRPRVRMELDLHDGARVIFAISVGRIGSEGCLILSFRDVTEDLALESELRRTTDFLEHLIESSSDAIIAADLRGHLMVYNRAAERLFGVPAEVAKESVNVTDLYPKGGAREVMRLLRESPTGHIEAVRTYGQNRSGESVPVELSAALLKMNGREIGSVGLLRDIRERVRVETELARTRARLIDAEKQRDIAALAGATAHELNQPLTVISGWLDLLLRRSEGPERSHLQAIADQTERMTEIVKRVAKLTHIRTVSYPGERVIADLELSSPSTPGNGTPRAG